MQKIWESLRKKSSSSSCPPARQQPPRQSSSPACPLPDHASSSPPTRHLLLQQPAATTTEETPVINANQLLRDLATTTGVSDKKNSAMSISAAETSRSSLTSITVSSSVSSSPPVRQHLHLDVYESTVSAPATTFSSTESVSFAFCSRPSARSSPAPAVSSPASLDAGDEPADDQTSNPDPRHQRHAHRYNLRLAIRKSRVTASSSSCNLILTDSDSDDQRCVSVDDVRVSDPSSLRDKGATLQDQETRTIDSFVGEKMGHAVIGSSSSPAAAPTTTAVISRVGSASLCEESSNSCASPSELDVPSAKSSRSKSFDYATQNAHTVGQEGAARKGPRASGGLLEIPKWKMFIRRASGPAASITSGTTATTIILSDLFWKDCVHCLLQEEWNKSNSAAVSCSPPPTGGRGGSYSSDSEDPDSMGMSVGGGGGVAGSGRRSVSGESLDEDESAVASPAGRGSKAPSPIPLLTLSIAPDDSLDEVMEEDLGNGVTVISLEVPVLPKSGRSASMDSSYLQVPRRTDIEDLEMPPGKSNRSRSVDIALPVGSDGPYIVVPSEKPVPVTTQ